MSTAGSWAARRQARRPPRTEPWSGLGSLAGVTTGSCALVEPPHFLSHGNSSFCPLSFLPPLCAHLLPSWASWAPLEKALSSVPDPQLGSAQRCALGEAWPQPGRLHLPRPALLCRLGGEGREAVPLPLHSQLSAALPPPDSTASRVATGAHSHCWGGGRPGEAQHKGCSLMRQLAPVKGPDENKRGGRGGTDGGERLAIQRVYTTADLY